MAISPFAWPYRQMPHLAYWGAANSQANFCEEDYIITPYVAEFINTFTNLIYVSYAIHGISKNWSHNDAFLRAVPYLGIMTVGIGSFFFHATMKYYTQWCDDISMIIATGAVFHRVYTFGRSPRIVVSSGIALVLLVAAFSTWHCVADEILVHNILFGTMICLVGHQTRSIISARIAYPTVRAEARKLANRSTTNKVVIFGLGYGLWIIDNMLCRFLTQTKRRIGMPWSFLLELHGWWHIFTGVGAYCHIALVEYLTSEDVGKPLGGHFAWPVRLIVNCSAGEVGEHVKTLSAKGRVTNDTASKEKKVD